MSVKENRALVRQMYELTNQGKLDAFYELVSPECVFHFPDGDMSKEEAKRFDTMWLCAFPDIRVAIEDMVAEGDKVAIRVNWRGTYQGEYMGSAPTGRKINITNANTIKITDGRWIEFWNVTDIRLARQLSGEKNATG